MCNLKCYTWAFISWLYFIYDMLSNFKTIFQYVTLRTRYSELMTLSSQYIKFIIETQRRLEDEEVSVKFVL